MKRIPHNNGAEADAFTRWRKLINWKRGALVKIKRQYRKRFRQKEKRLTQEND